MAYETTSGSLTTIQALSNVVVTHSGIDYVHKTRGPNLHPYTARPRRILAALPGGRMKISGRWGSDRAEQNSSAANCCRTYLCAVQGTRGDGQAQRGP